MALFTLVGPIAVALTKFRLCLMTAGSYHSGMRANLNVRRSPKQSYLFSWKGSTAREKSLDKVSDLAMILTGARGEIESVPCQDQKGIRSMNPRSVRSEDNNPEKGLIASEGKLLKSPLRQ
jgi:hypothetical protein